MASGIHCQSGNDVAQRQENYVVSPKDPLNKQKSSVIESEPGSCNIDDEKLQNINRFI